MILWFIATGVRPFDRVSASSVARKAARDGLRPDLQPVKDKHSLALVRFPFSFFFFLLVLFLVQGGCASEFAWRGQAAVISRCWAHKPEDRPSAMQLVRDLELQQVSTTPPTHPTLPLSYSYHSTRRILLPQYGWRGGIPY